MMIIANNNSIDTKFHEKNIPLNFKYHSTDNNFCRVYYTAKNHKGQSLLYCIQDDGKFIGLNLYRCSLDGEPEYPIIKRKDLMMLFDIPNGKTSIDKKVKELLTHDLL